MASDFNHTVKEFIDALTPLVIPLVRGFLGVLLGLGMLYGLLTVVCAPQIHQRSRYDEASKAFLDGLERYGRDSSKVEGTGMYQNGSRILVSGKIEWVDEIGLNKSEDVAGEYDLETRQLMQIKIGRDLVYSRERDGSLTAHPDAKE